MLVGCHPRDSSNVLSRIIRRVSRSLSVIRDHRGPHLIRSSPLIAADAAAAEGGVSRASFYETAKRYVLLALGQQVSSGDQAADDAAAGVTRLTRANIGSEAQEGEWVVLV